MPATTRYNWMVIAIALLVLVNIGTLAYLWLGKPKEMQPGNRPAGDAKNFIVQQLQLDQRQQQQFDSLRTIHFNEMNNYRKQMRELKDALFDKLKQPQDSGYISAAQQIGALQSQMDLSTFHHFKALRAICTQSQQAKFDNIIQEVLRNMGRPGGRPSEGDRRPPFDGPPPG